MRPLRCRAGYSARIEDIVSCRTRIPCLGIRRGDRRDPPRAAPGPAAKDPSRVSSGRRPADATHLEGIDRHFDTVRDSALYHCLSNGQRLYSATLHRVTRPEAQLHLSAFPTPSPNPYPDTRSSARTTCTPTSTAAGNHHDPAEALHERAHPRISPPAAEPAAMRQRPAWCSIPTC
jgi:hypothetical protein